jgi:hypothetical protein
MRNHEVLSSPIRAILYVYMLGYSQFPARFGITKIYIIQPPCASSQNFWAGTSPATATVNFRISHHGNMVNDEIAERNSSLYFGRLLCVPVYCDFATIALCSKLTMRIQSYYSKTTCLFIPRTATVVH